MPQRPEALRCHRRRGYHLALIRHVGVQGMAIGVFAPRGCVNTGGVSLVGRGCSHVYIKCCGCCVGLTALLIGSLTAQSVWSAGQHRSVGHSTIRRISVLCQHQSSPNTFTRVSIKRMGLLRNTRQILWHLVMVKYHVLMGSIPLHLC